MNYSDNNFGKTFALDTRGLWSHIAIINAVIIAVVFTIAAFFAILPANPPVF